MGAGDWTCTVTGDVLRVTREDNDKSGKNPKYTYVFEVAAVAVADLPEGRHLPPRVTFRVAHADLDKLHAAPPAEGEHLIITGRGNGPAPDSLYVVGLKRA